MHSGTASTEPYVAAMKKSFCVLVSSLYITLHLLYKKQLLGLVLWLYAVMFLLTHRQSGGLKKKFIFIPGLSFPFDAITATLLEMRLCFRTLS